MARDGKPPLSTLQRRAPAPLQINPPTIPISRETVFSCVPIPLLSPLVLSPERPASLQEADKTAPGSEVEGGAREQGGAAWTGPPMGWQHPAVPAAAEPSSLHSLFQAQCMLVSHAQ